MVDPIRLILLSLKLEKLGVEYLGVAIPEEGVELRRGGVKAPILVLGGIFGREVDQIFRFRAFRNMDRDVIGSFNERF